MPLSVGLGGCSEKLGSTILLKREDLQPIKSFQLRGAYNRMARLTPEQARQAQLLRLATTAAG